MAYMDYLEQAQRSFAGHVDTTEEAYNVMVNQSQTSYGDSYMFACAIYTNIVAFARWAWNGFD